MAIGIDLGTMLAALWEQVEAYAMGETGPFQLVGAQFGITEFSGSQCRQSFCALRCLQRHHVASRLSTLTVGVTGGGVTVLRSTSTPHTLYFGPLFSYPCDRYELKGSLSVCT